MVLRNNWYWACSEVLSSAVEIRLKIHSNNTVVRYHKYCLWRQVFKSIIPKIWNQLPSIIKSKTSLIKFIKCINKWFGSNVNVVSMGWFNLDDVVVIIILFFMYFNTFTQCKILLGLWVIRPPAPGPHIRLSALGPHKILTSLNWI